MLLSFEPFDEICIVSGSRIAALYYTDRVTLVCLHAQSLELTLKPLEQALDTTPIETFWERTRYPNSWHNFTTGNLGKVVHPGPVMQLLLTFRDRQAVS
jgi:hypothetical protein